MKLRGLSVFTAALLFVAACSTTPRPTEMAAVELDVRGTSPIFFGSGRIAPVNLDVTLTNNASVPITVRSIRFSSRGMVNYGIQAEEKYLTETLGPGMSRTMPVQLTAISAGSGSTATEPLTLRADVYYDIGGRYDREFFTFVGLQFPG